MSWHDTVPFLACAFGAEVIGTIAGFGAATILTPVAVLFMDMKTAIAMVACFHLFGTASRLVFFGRHVSWMVWAQFGVVAVVCSVVGARLNAGLPSSVVTFAFGLFLLGYVAVSLFAGNRVQLPKRRSTLLGGGVVAGLVAGLLGTGGAIRSACLLAFGLPKEVYLGTSAAIALSVDVSRVPVYLAGGLIPGRMLPVVIGLIGVAFAGAWVGQRLVRRVSVVAFRRLVIVMLALMGLRLAMEGWHGLG